jgi:ATP-dependent DNA helicase RecG
MEAVEVLECIARGEDTRHQFKREMKNPESLASEFVAFSNSSGGFLIIGVADDGTISGLTAKDIRELNQLVGNASTQGMNPAITVETENVQLPQGVVTVITVPEGISKPYMDKNGIIWIKTGSDKRRATSREEIQRIFQKEGIIHADETEVTGLSSADIDIGYFKSFFEKQFGRSFDSQPNPLPTVLKNMNLLHDGSLTVAGAVLFAQNAYYRLPSFTVKAVAFPGTTVSDSVYLDKREIKGKLADIFQQTVSFIMMNIPHAQGNQNFNSNGESVIPRTVVEELIANALVHRDYFIPSSVKVFVFTDRVEIISPGHLTNNLTVENIKAGNSVSRNPVIASYAAGLLPYSGIGTGIRRALTLYPNIQFEDDRDGNQFKVTISF